MATPTPDALLLIASGCAHCPVVLAALAEMVKQGTIGSLEVVNVGSHPARAQALGVRGVPWLKIGPFELSGAHSRSELEDWAARAGDEQGIRDYLAEGLGSGRLEDVTAACRRNPDLLPTLIALAGDLDTPFAVRVGVGAVLEELGDEHRLGGLVDALAVLAASEQAQVRADAAHFLGLTGTGRAGDHLQRLLQDDNAQVREIAAESLATLAAAGASD